MFKQRTGIVVALAIVVLIVAGSGAAASSGTAYVSLQAVLEQHPGLSDAQAEFQAAAAEMEQEMENASEEEQQALMGQYQQMLQQLEQELQMNMLDDILLAIEAVGDSMGFDMIVEDSVVLYGGTDISSDVTAYLVENF